MSKRRDCRQQRHRQLFSAGEVFATDDALTAIEAMGLRSDGLVALHACGEWGEVSHEEAGANNRAVAEGGVVRSVYRLPTGIVVIETTADRSSTTITVQDAPLE